MLWAVRFRSPGGDWVAASSVRSSFPEWSELGLPEAHFSELERRESGLCLVLGGGVSSGICSPARDALAAWLHRRSRQRNDGGIVVEDFPRYDWSALAGDWRGLPAGWIRREGRLDSVVRASGLRTIVWIGACPASMLGDFLELAASGALVVLAEEGMELEAWLARAGRILQSSASAPSPVGADPGLVWRLSSGATASGLPLRSRLDPIARTNPTD